MKKLERIDQALFAPVSETELSAVGAGTRTVTVKATYGANGADAEASVTITF